MLQDKKQLQAVTPNVEVEETKKAKPSVKEIEAAKAIKEKIIVNNQIVAK